MDVFDNITLIHGDCMEYLRSLPDNAFDLAVVDPPYGDGNFQTPPHKRAMSRDGGGVVRPLQATDGTDSERGSTVTREPSQLRALTGRFQKYSRQIPPNVLIINQKVYGGTLRQAKSILMNYSESAKIRLYGAAITSICHLLGVSLYGANYLSPRNSQWRCVNTLGLRSMQMQKYSSVFRKVRRKTPGFIRLKNLSSYINGL